MIPLQYEIKICPIKNSSDLVRVSCWVKIKAEIGRNDCRSTRNNTTETFIRLNSINCKLDLKQITISKLNAMAQIQLLGITTNSVESDLSSEEFSSVPYRYVLQLGENLVNVAAGFVGCTI